MRPRVFPAEDASGHPDEAPGGRGASMRPRVFPAEDGQHRRHPQLQARASMRPRVFPAEDLGARCSVSPRSSSFNEAAGIPRGRHRLTEQVPSNGAASMRPRVFPAEDSMLTS